MEFKDNSYFNNLSKELDTLQFIKDLRKEDNSLWKFIKHIHYSTASKYLVAKLQDQKYSTIRYSNMNNNKISI